MTVKELIAYVKEVRETDSRYSDAVLIRWLNEIEGTVQSEIFLLAPEDIIEYTAGDLAADADDKELLVPAPYNKLYYAYIEAAIDFQNGEYSEYANTMERFNQYWRDYAAWYAKRIHPADGRAEFRGYYLSTYAIAVKHGYEGTEAEWIAAVEAARTDAEGAAADAAASATAAATSETNASASAAAAAGSEATVSGHASEAASSALSAARSATEAASSASSATAALNGAVAASGSASASATSAGNSAAAANTSALAASAAANSAEAAMEKYPRIKVANKHWEIYNPAAQAWVDTGVLAEGEDGEPGDDGVRGSLWYTGTAITNPLGDPTVIPGELPGDLYLNTDTNDIYRLHEGTLIWLRVAQLGSGGGNVDSVNGKTGVVVLDAEDVGAYELPSGGIPKSDLAAAVQTSLGLADTALQSSQKGSANGVAELDENGRVPSAQLPSYVDDVLEYASTSAFPATGENGKIYVAADTNLTYRWTGSAYTEISPSVALGETSSTAYRGDRGKTAYDHSQATGNPHSTTLAQINGDSTHRTVTDAEKAAWNAKQSALTAGAGISISGGVISCTFADGNGVSY